MYDKKIYIYKDIWTYVYIYIYIYVYMVGGLEHFLFSIIYGIILPIDELIFFKMVKTTKQNSTNNNDSGIDRIVMG